MEQSQFVDQIRLLFSLPLLLPFSLSSSVSLKINYKFGRLFKYLKSKESKIELVTIQSVLKIRAMDYLSPGVVAIQHLFNHTSGNHGIKKPVLTMAPSTISLCLKIIHCSSVMYWFDTISNPLVLTSMRFVLTHLFITKTKKMF